MSDELMFANSYRVGASFHYFDPRGIAVKHVEDQNRKSVPLRESVVIFDACNPRKKTKSTTSRLVASDSEQ
jgi:hypothetical protein